MKAATSKDDQAAMLEKAHLAEIQESEDFKRVMESPHGLRFIQRIINEGKPFTRGFFGNSKDIFAFGKRDFALWVFHEVCKSCPEKLPLLAIPPKEEVQEVPDEEEDF